MRYSKEKLEELSNSVIKLSHSTGDSLVSSVLEVLKDNPMNPEQIKRLVEMTNTNTFLDKFKQTAGDDRFVDFDVLDPMAVIKSFLGGSMPKGAVSKSKGLSLTITSTPEGTTVRKRTTRDPGLDTDESRFFENITSTKEKKSSLAKLAEDKKFSPKYDKNPALKGRQSELPDDIQKKIITSKIQPHNKKMLEDKLLTKKESAEYECDFLAAKLASKFKGIYSKSEHTTFEKEALANFGVDALPALQAVRAKLSMPLLNGNVNMAELAKAASYYVADKKSKGMKEVGTYIDKLSSYVEANLELQSFYRYTNDQEKLAGLEFPNLINTFGLGDAGSGLLSAPVGTTSYVLNKRIHNWADRIQARDETLKDIRSKAVGYALDGLTDRMDDFFDDRKKRNTRAEQKQRRMHAAKQMFKSNPDLRSGGKENLAMAINMVGKVAPELSTSVPFLTAHVRQMMYNSEGGIPVLDAQSIKSMSDAERAFENLGKYKPA